MLDLRATTPYYDAGLCLALRDAGVGVRLFSSPPRVDPGLLRRLEVPMAPGLVGRVEKLRIKRQRLRRVLRAVQLCVNAGSTWVRLLANPPEVVHLQWLSLPEAPVVEILLMRLLQRRGCTVALTVHNVVPHEGKGRRLASTYRTPDVVLCHTREAAEQLSSEFGIPARRISVVHEGPIVGADAASDVGAASATSDPTVLFCGVMRPYKGAQVLLDAWAVVSSGEVPGRLIIAGGGHADELEKISAGVARRKLSNVTLLLQSMTTAELVRLHTTSDIVVLPYLHASGSESLIRAMTAGLAVIASATGGLQEWVDHRKTGILVPPGDAVALAGALRELLTRPDLRAAYAAAGQNYVNTTLSWTEAARRTLAAYSSTTRQA